ncbi:MAG TPA: SEC-C metal-binding domain-containing protein, partial [Vicinamibacteria bacterium]
AVKKKAEEGELPPNAWEEALQKAKKEVANEHEEVVDKGGLHILGTERHESRRIDNQLRGRAGRQGDPGSSRFYLSLEDDLMRIFGSDRISGLMQRMGMEEGVPIEHGMVTRAIERAQKQVEGQNFSMRKHLLEYDDVMNKQRVAIYRLRREILEGREQREYVLELAENVLEYLLDTHLGPETPPEEWDIEGFRQALGRPYGLDSTTLAGIDWAGLSREEIRKALSARILEKYQKKEATIGPDLMRTHEKIIMLQVVDTQWKDHLYAMDHLKEGIGLRGYGQRDPLIEYKKESFTMFEAMWDRIEEEIVRILFLLQPVREPSMDLRPAPRPLRLTFNDPAATPSALDTPRAVAPTGVGPRRESQGGVDAAVKTVRRAAEKVGRNDPCPCGSGKKYKKCCGVGA